MATVAVDVFRNYDAESTDLDEAFDAVVDAADDIYGSTGHGYEVRKRDHTFSIGTSGRDTQDILNDFEYLLAGHDLYDPHEPRCYLLVYESGDPGYAGQARYETGNPWDDDRRDYQSQGNRYGLAVADFQTTADRNVAVHEVLHTFMRYTDGDPWGDHEKGAVYFTDEVSPMATGYAGDLDEYCRNEGSGEYYVNTLTTCTKDGVDEYLDHTWSPA